jgi:hypothetical protein
VASAWCLTIKVAGAWCLTIKVAGARRLTFEIIRADGETRGSCQGQKYREQHYYDDDTHLPHLDKDSLQHDDETPLID